MKKSVVTAFAILVAAFSFAQTTSVAEIEKAAAEIKNARSTFKKIEKYNDSTGSKVLYLNIGKLQLVEIKQYYGTTERTFEWYFQDDNLVYSSQNTVNGSVSKTIISERFYEDKGKLIKWVRDGVEVDPSSNDFKMMESRLIRYTKTLLEEAKQ